MAEAATLTTFALTSLLLELTPGPNMAYLALIAATDGRKPGYAAVAGVAVGLAVVGLAAALGLSALLRSSPIAYQALRWAGVGYLLWLAWQGWHGGADTPEHADVGSSLGLFFWRGLLTNLLNPKAAVFFVMVLPGFLLPRAIFADVITLSGIYVGVATIVHAAIVTAAGTAHDWLADDGRKKTARRVLSLALVVVAGWLLWKT